MGGERDKGTEERRPKTAGREEARRDHRGNDKDDVKGGADEEERFNATRMIFRNGSNREEREAE